VFEVNNKNRESVRGFPRNCKFGFEVLDVKKVKGFEVEYSLNFKEKLHPVVSPNTPDWNWIK
jgi:hypothetical protein